MWHLHIECRVYSWWYYGYGRVPKSQGTPYSIFVVYTFITMENSLNVILPKEIPNHRIVTSTMSDLVNHWGYVLFCYFNNDYDLHLVDISHTGCESNNSDLFNNRDTVIKVIYCAPPFLDLYEEWEEAIIIQVLGGTNVLKLHCPVCGTDNWNSFI